MAAAVLGQHGNYRLLETAEMPVVWLMTQRSRVQIPPPLLISQVRGLFRSWKGPSACAVCTELCTKPLRRAGPPWRLGVRRTPEVVRDAGGVRLPPRRCAHFICDKLQMKCNSPTIDP